MQQFLDHGYPEGIVRAAVNQANQRNRESLFEPRGASSQDTRLYWAMDFTPRSKEMVQIVKKIGIYCLKSQGVTDSLSLAIEKHSRLRRY